MTQVKVAGAVVVYNSNLELFENIDTYIGQVGKLYIVDNSDIINEKFVDQVKSLDGVAYVSNEGNLGVAYALNVAANLAIADGYTHLLTMDDDSKAPKGMVYKMIDFINYYSAPETIGILSVAHSKPRVNQPFGKVDLTMTSGNLLSLRVFQKIGPFDEKLFIDHVDHEYNIRLSINKFQILEITDLKLDHKLGEKKQFRFSVFKITYISHSPVRLYYFIRNATYILLKYFRKSPTICFTIAWISTKEALKACVFEGEKKLRLKFIKQAIVAGYQEKMGKFNSCYGG